MSSATILSAPLTQATAYLASATVAGYGRDEGAALRSARDLAGTPGISYNAALNTLVITQDGLSLDHVDFRGVSVVVRANGVSITQSAFDAAANFYAIRQMPGYDGLTIDHSTFDGLKLDRAYGDFVVGSGTNLTLTANVFQNAPADAIQISGGRVAGNYFVGGGYAAGAHADAIWVTASTGPVTIEGNLIDWRASLDAQVATNQAIRVTGELGAVSNVAIRDNVLLGGSFTLGIAERGSGATSVTGISVTGNVVGGAMYGDLYPSPQADLVYTGNQHMVVAGPILGSAGNDRLTGTTGADAILGGKGDDTLLSGQGDDTLYGGQGNDVAYAGQGADLVFGNLGADILLGNLGADTLLGGQGDDTLYGGQGDDVLSGDLGNDVLSGDLGADRYVFGPNSGADLILGFDRAGGDRIDLQGQGYSLGTAPDGNALLVLSGGGTIELAGIAPGQVDGGFFV